MGVFRPNAISIGIATETGNHGREMAHATAEAIRRVDIPLATSHDGDVSRCPCTME